MLKLNEKIELLKLLIIKDRLRMPEKMKAILKPKRYKFAWGGRGGSKSTSIAKAILYRANTEKIRVLCGREIQNSLQESVFNLLTDLIKKLEYTDFEPTKNIIRNKRTESEIIFTGFYGQEKKQTLKSLEGVDIAWIEEAQTLSKNSIQLLDPTIRKDKSEIWFGFNRLMPDDPVWIFKEKIPSELKTEIDINYSDNPYLPPVLVEQALRDKENFEKGLNDDYPHIWLGDPIGLSERNIFRLSEIINAMDREINPVGEVQIGADIARFGDDRIVFYKRQGLKVIGERVLKKLNLVETSNQLIEFANYNKNIPIKIDDTGVGGGVTDILKSNGYNVVPVNFAQSPNDSNKYPNAISEMWFSLKNMINEVELCNDIELKSELATREWKIDNKGRRCVESKEDYKRRYYKSPDKADAVLLCFYEPIVKINKVKVIDNFF